MYCFIVLYKCKQKKIYKIILYLKSFTIFVKTNTNTMTNYELKIRVLEAKKKLPKSGVTSLFFYMFPKDYKENKTNKAKLNNVLQTRVADEDMTLKIEKLVNLLND